MWNKVSIWWTTVDNGWKVFMSVIAVASVIGTAAIKVNKGIELMSDTAKTVKEIKHGYDSLQLDVNEIKKSIVTYSAKQGAQAESYVDHLKLEKRLDEVIKFYERMARAEEKKNFSPIP